MGCWASVSHSSFLVFEMFQLLSTHPESLLPHPLKAMRTSNWISKYLCAGCFRKIFLLGFYKQMFLLGFMRVVLAMRFWGGGCVRLAGWHSQHRARSASVSFVQCQELHLCGRHLHQECQGVPGAPDPLHEEEAHGTESGKAAVAPRDAESAGGSAGSRQLPAPGGGAQEPGGGEPLGAACAHMSGIVAAQRNPQPWDRFCSAAAVTGSCGCLVLLEIGAGVSCMIDTQHSSLRALPS